MKHLNKIVILFLLGAVGFMYFYCCGSEDITQGKYVEGKVVNVAYEHYGKEYYGTVELCDSTNHVCRYVFFKEGVTNKNEATSKNSKVLIKLKKSRNTGFVFISELKLKTENDQIDKMEITEELTNKIPFDSHGYSHNRPNNGNHNIWHINKNTINFNNIQEGHVLVDVYPKGGRPGDSDKQLYIQESDVILDTIKGNVFEYYESVKQIRNRNSGMEIKVGLIHQH